MPRYEIINPSDKCFLSGENLEAICAAVALIGDGKYGLTSDDGSTVMPVFILGGRDAWWKEKFGHEAQEFVVRENFPAIAAALRSFRYETKRSSMNNIGAAARAMAKHLEEANG